MKIYTRTGDRGKTSLFDGTRVPKSNIRIEAYGTIDELNSVIGVGLAQLRTKNAKLKTVKTGLEKIQHDLYNISSTLALPHEVPVVGLQEAASGLEKIIDDLTDRLPKLTEFIIPGGSKAGSMLHVARTVARRAERRLVQLAEQEPIDEAIVVYVNRLSDLLFTIARFVNYIDKQQEIKWIKK